MDSRLGAWCMGLLLVAGGLAGCSRPEASGDGRALLPTPAYGASYVDSLPSGAALPDPSGACRSAVPAGTVLAPNLRANQVVVAAVACGHLATGDGVPLVVTRQARGAALDQLTAALRLMSARTGGICDASGRSVPVFAVQLQDGRWVNPDIPSDGCHPRGQVLTALREVLEQP